MKQFSRHWTHHVSITNWYRWRYSTRPIWMQMWCRDCDRLAIGWPKRWRMVALQVSPLLHVKAINWQAFMIRDGLAATAFSKSGSGCTEAAWCACLSGSNDHWSSSSHLQLIPDNSYHAEQKACHIQPSTFNSFCLFSWFFGCLQSTFAQIHIMRIISAFSVPVLSDRIPFICSSIKWNGWGMVACRLQSSNERLLRCISDMQAEFPSLHRREISIPNQRCDEGKKKCPWKNYYN